MTRAIPLLFLLAAILGAGCTGPGTTPPGGDLQSAVPTATPAGTTTEDCSFDRLAWNDDIHFLKGEPEGREPEGEPTGQSPGGDSCYFRTHTPVQFLDDLRAHPQSPAMVLDVPGGWITVQDAELLMREIGSTEPAGAVVSPLSSYWPSNQTSTVGNEALFLLEGYRAGRYPPALCSLYYFRPNRTEVEAWWGSYGRWRLPDEREAIRIVQHAYPELASYPSDELPPKSIRTVRSFGGWYVAFLQEGSGLPILSARCFFVSDSRAVTVTGMVNESIMVLPQDFSPLACGALPAPKWDPLIR